MLVPVPVPSGLRSPPRRTQWSGSHARVPSQNAYYNDWAARVDANRDGMISDNEALAMGPQTAPFIETPASDAPTPYPEILPPGRPTPIHPANHATLRD